MTCYRRKSTIWPGKLISSKKKPKNNVFWRQEIGITSLWEDLEAKLLTPGQLLGYPWKVLGIKVQTSYWEGRWHQNWVRSRLTKKIACGHANSWKKRKFFSLRPPSRKGREISGWVQWVKWCPHIGQQIHCWQSVAARPFWLCFACPKLGDAGRTRVASKNRAVMENLGGRNFDFRAKSSRENFL